MPPKVRITKEEIINVTIALVQRDGAEAINARTVAKELSCSTQPIFSNFATMDDLQNAVNREAYERYLAFIKQEVESGKYPPYKAYGMAYIRFAKEEKELFKLIFMCDREKKEMIATPDFEESVKMIMQANGMTQELAEKLHLEMWIWVHGVATMLVTSYLTLEWEQISEMLSDIYQGVRLKLSSEEEKI